MHRIYPPLFFDKFGAPPALPSFPTRRSSDLGGPPSHGASGRSGPSRSSSLRERRRGPLSRRRGVRSEEHTSELQSLRHLVCRLLLEKKKKKRRSPGTCSEDRTDDAARVR